MPSGSRRATVLAAERQCRGFGAWEVSQEGHHPVLPVSAKPSAPDEVAPIAALFGADCFPLSDRRPRL